MHNHTNTSLSAEITGALPDQISAMLAYWDADLICRYANRAYMDWFGLSPDLMIDQITMRELLGPLYLQNLPYIKGALAGQKQTFEREIPNPNGGKRHSLANYYPDIENGTIKGFFVHVADITPVKLAEDTLLKKNMLLSDQNTRLLNFAYIVSHNLNSYVNNLTAVLDMHDELESEFDRNKIMSFLKDIAKGFRSTITNLNQVVHAQSLIAVAHQSVNLYNYVENAVRDLGIQFASSKIMVFNRIPPDAQVLTNPAYAESIILNLLTNAIKYRHPNRPPEVVIEYYNENGYSVLSVSDNGLGIDLQRHGDDIFGMYKTFHGNADASGIGLFITRFQIESMDGRIEVESEEGQGSVFRVYFSSTSAGR
jgi:PAS domain S-box-containing protein